MSWAPPRASFHLRLTAPAKNDSESGPKHIYVSEHKIYCFIGWQHEKFPKTLYYENRDLMVHVFFAVAFHENETSPSLIMIKEKGQLKLHCSYCANSPQQVFGLFWYKENQMIRNSTHYTITNHGKDLGIPVVQQGMDEGLFICEVVSYKQNISKLITVIVKKGKQ